MTNFTDMLSKAKAMQDKMKEAQEQIKKIEVEGTAGGNLVTVKLAGDYELKSIKISDSAKKEDREIINDLIIAAYNNAKQNLKKKSAEELSKVTGGLNLPFDLKLPLMDNNIPEINELIKQFSKLPVWAKICKKNYFKINKTKIVWQTFCQVIAQVYKNVCQVIVEIKDN